jgi:hypothetical protein
MATLEHCLQLRKNRAGELNIPVEWAYVHAAIIAHDESLKCTLLGMKARVGRDQSTAGLECDCGRS